MQIRVNGELMEIPQESTLLDLLSLLGMDKSPLAAAVNSKVVPRGRHSEQVLGEGDRVELIRAVGGG